MDFCIVVNEGQVLTLCLSPFQRHVVSSIREQRDGRSPAVRPVYLPGYFSINIFGLLTVVLFCGTKIM